MHAGVEQRGDRVGERLAGGVVDVDLEHHDRLPAQHRVARCADHDLRGVGLAVEIAGAGAEAAAVDRHRRHRAEPRGERGQQRRARRSGELHAEVDAAGGGADAGEQLHHRGGRVGQEPVGGSHHPGAGDDHRAVHDVDVEHLERGAGADDIDDGVEAADLVEVDLLGRPAVEAPLGLGEGGEDGEGTASDAIGQPSLFDEGGDVGGGAHDRGLVGVDVGLGRADAAAEHGSASRRQPCTGRRSTMERTSSTSAPASMSEPRAMSPAMPEKQWNQASLVT